MSHIDHDIELREQGYTILTAAIDPDLIRELREALLRIEREHEIGFRSTQFEGLRTVRIYNLLKYGKPFDGVVLHDRVLPIVEDVLGPDILLSSLSSITLAPGQEGQPVHTDTQQIPFPRPFPAVSVNAMWALTDFTAANGATRIVPGSHRFGGAPVYGQTYDMVAAEMPAGSVMLFDSELWHAGGANRTDARRYAISCYYCAGWMRQQENMFLGVPLETMKQYPRRLQELCGYSLYKGQYGHLEGRDPIEVLGREQIRKTVWKASDAHRKRHS